MSLYFRNILDDVSCLLSRNHEDDIDQRTEGGSTVNSVVECTNAIVSTNINPLLLYPVVRLILKKLSLKEKITIRLTCRFWNEHINTSLRNTSEIDIRSSASDGPMIVQYIINVLPNLKKITIYDGTKEFITPFWKLLNKLKEINIIWNEESVPSFPDVCSLLSISDFLNHLSFDFSSSKKEKSNTHSEDPVREEDRNTLAVNVILQQPPDEEEIVSFNIQYTRRDNLKITTSLSLCHNVVSEMLQLVSPQNSISRRFIRGDADNNEIRELQMSLV